MLGQNVIRYTFKLASDLKKNTKYLLSYNPLNEGHSNALTNSLLRTYSDIDYGRYFPTKFYVSNLVFVF